jgi:PAS domain S-box-containing protein
MTGGEMSWSDELFRILGHEPQSMTVTCETLFASLLPDDHDRVLTALNEALTAKAPAYDVECRIVRPSGEIRFIHCRGEVMRDEAGYPATVAGICLDITDRKRMEEALRSGEERWQLALLVSLDGIRDWNMRTGEVFYSPRCKALLGYADHELTDSLDEWRSRIHPDDLERVLQRLDAYVDRHCPEFSEEYRIQRKDGSYLWILDRAAALWDEQGRPCRLVGSVAAISDPEPAGDAPGRGQE